jgi:hypothetical protein
VERILNEYPQYEGVIRQLIEIGQAERIFGGSFDEAKFSDLMEKLVAMDRFYREIGGIAGYQKKVLELLRGKEERIERIYHAPKFIEIGKESEVGEAIEWGIDAMAEMAEIYPLGGAADRLHLVENGVELPAAKLVFGGRQLLEHLIRDLEAREELYFEKRGKRILTPVAMMTSMEKNNHAHVVEICEKANWFGRPRESFRFFTQPLVPAVDGEGNWALLGPMKLLMKPGGHGAIWKLARDEGIFDWFESWGRSKALIRQINNPIAGLDYGLLAFQGIGWKKKMVFGFASCPRLLKAAEGVNVVVEKEGKIALTNVEYCDFPKFGIEDLPLKEGEPYSRFSSNTNILFADLKAIRQAIDACPFPGLLINLKKTSYVTEGGERKEEPIARLESTMQNIADVFVEEKKEGQKTEKTFVTYNWRHKTISTAKKAYIPGGSLLETPENCFYELLGAHRELLLECGFDLPAKRSVEEYLEKGPEFSLLYHPKLGPLYRKIRSKLKGGKLALSAELVLEIADLKIENLGLDGSLLIEGTGTCRLKNVRIKNRGVNWEQSRPFWKGANQRAEAVKIILKDNSEFVAENVEWTGNQLFVVEKGEAKKIASPSS